MAPIIKTFNCISTSTPIVPLKRPYYCCGWYEPPKWFSGKYVIYRTGNPPPTCGRNNNICTGPEGIPIKLELESDCGAIYIWKSKPDYEVFGFYTFQLCTSPDGSDSKTTFIYNDPYCQDCFLTECSYDLITKEYKFLFKNEFFLDYGNGNTFYRYVELDTVKME